MLKSWRFISSASRRFNSHVIEMCSPKKHCQCQKLKVEYDKIWHAHHETWWTWWAYQFIYEILRRKELLWKPTYFSSNCSWKTTHHELLTALQPSPNPASNGMFLRTSPVATGRVRTFKQALSDSWDLNYLNSAVIKDVIIPPLKLCIYAVHSTQTNLCNDVSWVVKSKTPGQSHQTSNSFLQPFWKHLLESWEWSRILFLLQTEQKKTTTKGTTSFHFPQKKHKCLFCFKLASGAVCANKPPWIKRSMMEVWMEEQPSTAWPLQNPPFRP